MTLPVSKSLVRNDYERVWNALVTLQSDCLLVQSSTAGGAAGSLIYVLAVAQDALNLTQLLSTFNADSTLMAGIVTYAQQQSPGATFSLTDFVNAYNAANALLNAVAAQYPVDGSGHLLDRTWSSTAGVQWASATAAVMPNVMSAIAAYLATLS